MANNPQEETYTEAEAAKRAAATLRVMLATKLSPHKPLGKRKKPAHKA